MASNNPTHSVAALERPRLAFEAITFSDGSTLSFEDDDIVVFVGPNNAGKSATLREMEAMVARTQPGVIVHSASLKKTGDSASLRAYLDLHSQKSQSGGELRYGGIGFNIYHNQISWFDNPSDRHPVAPFFAKRLATETRIQDSDAASAIALFSDAPTHPIHTLLMDEKLAAEVSAKFRHAFGADLIPFRAGGGNFPLYVGEKPKLASGKDELSREFVEELQRTSVQLDSQGDGMRSFAAVLLHILAASHHSIQFLDEPEAFLHPPQARLLGKYIAEGRRTKSQLFIATHSTDILDGLIEGGSDKVRIIRIRREGKINRVKELSKSQTQAVAKDTLTRFSKVFDGIFFEHVIVCESDADCMFYQAILNLPSISGERRPDVLFVHTAGKHRMSKLADTLRALDVPVSVIADIDALNDETTFKTLVEKLGGTWSELRPHWQSVYNSVLSQRPPLNATQVKGMIGDLIDDVAGTDEFPRAKENEIKRVFKTVSPWSALKQSGRRGLPSGEPTIQYDQLAEKCAAIGLWIVPVGELEGFCQSLGSHGPGFVEKVLETRNLETDAELAEARDFVGRIWQRGRT
ncbi:AAA family ATPase [Erythrobacter sp. T5W1-R]|uniref:ATP-dependent nuclease n=1 Tax=Erythrobacter sp. T5W1-R TaxID=3101752 RepID=UPI002B001262|nr:AAA family ATPase [Erythrobacter sp. T5W1-R]MEA1619421.1 AAA family ATPase [Erythrobacter sp. T5W1-R]